MDVVFCCYSCESKVQQANVSLAVVFLQAGYLKINYCAHFSVTFTTHGNDLLVLMHQVWFTEEYFSINPGRLVVINVSSLS